MTTSKSAPPATAVEFREQLGKEYGVYVAKAAIDINGSRAFNAGDPVPVSHVQRQVVDRDQVLDNKQVMEAAEAASTDQSQES